MKLIIKYTSQIAMAAGTNEESIDSSNSSLIELIKEISKSKNDQFNSLLWMDEESINPSILIIINGNQITDLSEHQVKDGDEIMLFSPMSGG